MKGDRKRGEAWQSSTAVAAKTEAARISPVLRQDRPPTQGRRLIAALKRKPMTSMQVQLLGISTCWWKRVRESLNNDKEVLAVYFKYVNNKSLKVYQVMDIRRP